MVAFLTAVSSFALVPSPSRHRIPLATDSFNTPFAHGAFIGNFTVIQATAVHQYAANQNVAVFIQPVLSGNFQIPTNNDFARTVLGNAFLISLDMVVAHMPLVGVNGAALLQMESGDSLVFLTLGIVKPTIFTGLIIGVLP